MSEHCTHFISGITFGSYWAEKENITRMISSSFEDLEAESKSTSSEIMLSMSIFWVRF